MTTEPIQPAPPESAITAAARAYIEANAIRLEQQAIMDAAERTILNCIPEDGNDRAIVAEGWVFIIRGEYINEAMPIEGVAL